MIYYIILLVMNVELQTPNTERIGVELEKRPLNPPDGVESAFRLNPVGWLDPGWGSYRRGAAAPKDLVRTGEGW